MVRVVHPCLILGLGIFSLKLLCMVLAVKFLQMPFTSLINFQIIRAFLNVCIMKEHRILTENAFSPSTNMTIWLCSLLY